MEKGQKISLQDQTAIDGAGKRDAQITGMIKAQIVDGILMRRLREKEAILDIATGEIIDGLNEVTGKSDERSRHLHRSIIR